MYNIKKILITVMVLITIASVALADDKHNNNGNSWEKVFKELQKQIDILRDQIKDLQKQMKNHNVTGVPGPAGPQGINGTPGVPGPAGINGTDIHLGTTVPIELAGPIDPQPPLTPVFYYDVIQGIPLVGHATEDGFLTVNSLTENSGFAVTVGDNTYYVRTSGLDYEVNTFPVAEGETWTITYISGYNNQVSIFWKPMVPTAQ